MKIEKRGKQKSRTANTTYNLLTGFASEFFMYILNFVSRTVFVHVLGSEYLGISGLFSNILTMLSLADLGIASAINYRLYKPIAQGDTERIKELVKYFKKVYCVIGWVMFALGLCVIPFLKFLIKDYETFSVLGISAPLIFIIYLLQSVSTYWFFAYKTSVLKADQKEYVLNIASYGTTLFAYLVEIVTLVLTKDFTIYISVVIITNILQNFVYAKIADYYCPYINEDTEKELSKSEKKEIFKDCKAITMFSLSAVILKATDNIVLSAFIGLSIVGLYSNYLMIYNMCKKIIKKTLRAMQASLGNLFARVNGEIKQKYFNIINYVTVLFGGTISVSVAALMDEFITVWIGEKYIIADPFSILIALEIYTIALKINLEMVRETVGLFQKMKWRPVVSVVLNLTISITLVQHIGIYGVILGTLISEWTSTFLMDPYIIFKYGFLNAKDTYVYYGRNVIYLVELKYRVLD